MCAYFNSAVRICRATATLSSHGLSRWMWVFVSVCVHLCVRVLQIYMRIMYTCTPCECMYVCIWAFMHTCCAYICIMHMCACICAHIHIYKNIMYVHTWIFFFCSCVFVCALTHRSVAFEHFVHAVAFTFALMRSSTRALALFLFLACSLLLAPSLSHYHVFSLALYSLARSLCVAGKHVQVHETEMI